MMIKDFFELLPSQWPKIFKNVQNVHFIMCIFEVLGRNKILLTCKIGPERDLKSPQLIGGALVSTNEVKLRLHAEDDSLAS